MYRTLEQRKRDAAARRAAAPEALRSRLQEFALASHGRYLIYGSLARGKARYDSDIDILVDFPEASQTEAWRRAEEACAALGIDYDILPLSWARPRFLERALAAVITIPRATRACRPCRAPSLNGGKQTLFAI